MRLILIKHFIIFITETLTTTGKTKLQGPKLTSTQLLQEINYIFSVKLMLIISIYMAQYIPVEFGRFLYVVFFSSIKFWQINLFFICRHQHLQPSKKIMTFMQGTTSSRTSITMATSTLGSVVTQVTSYPLWWAPECPRYLPLPSPWISLKPLHLGSHPKTWPLSECLKSSHQVSRQTPFYYLKNE